MVISITVSTVKTRSAYQTRSSFKSLNGACKVFAEIKPKYLPCLFCLVRKRIPASAVPDKKRWSAWASQGCSVT